MYLTGTHCTIPELVLSTVCFPAGNEAGIYVGGMKMVLEKIKEILGEQFDVSPDTILPETTLAEDLGADSLDVVDLLMSIEDEFEVEIPDEEVENIKTVGALVEYIESHSKD